MKDPISLLIALAAIGCSICAIRNNRRAKAIRERSDRTVQEIYRRTAEIYRSVGVGASVDTPAPGEGSRGMDALKIPVTGHEKCQIVLGRAGIHRVWRVECDYCGLVTEWVKGYGANADLALLHVQQKHSTSEGTPTNPDRKRLIARMLAWMAAHR